MSVSLTIDDFLQKKTTELLGLITSSHSQNHNSLSREQINAWYAEFKNLQEALSNKKGRIIFEYSIPGLPKTIDVVLLIENVIYVLEYKVNSSSYDSQAIQQVHGYALRLKFFHSRSNDNWIAPILIATDAPDEETVLLSTEEDMVYKTICCNAKNLQRAIDTIKNKPQGNVILLSENEWENGIFKASSTIIEAARNVWLKNNVHGFTLGEADEATRLSAENYIKNTVIPETKSRETKKSICFVTGVPGAGKTLIGLNTSVALQDEGASMLSGNDPLVAVLTKALQNDLKKNRNNLIKSKDEISVETIIRSAYGYKKEIFEKRLDYTPGIGTVSRKPNSEVCAQHVIIFDEAQRAWNKDKMIQPGRAGKKYWQEPNFPFSEPALLLWDLNQLDWAVMVCLVGGGQEINDGEAGICEWLHALKYNDHFKDWHVYISQELLGAEYNRPDPDAETVKEYCSFFEKSNRLTQDKSLHLSACQRSNRSDKVAAFIQNLLDCKTKEARELYETFKDKYPIYLTRNVTTAQKKLRSRRKDLIDRNLIDEKYAEDFRIGMLMSSSAARIRPLGYEIRKVTEFLDKTAKWFLDDSSNVYSSNFLEIALNEFFVQGLELDYSAVIWDADFRYNNADNRWDSYEFSKGIEWRPIKNASKIVYLKNAYRVLLTRARVGMVIVIPKGSELGEKDKPIDSTRSPEFYDSTYNYLLKQIGLTPLPDNNL